MHHEALLGIGVFELLLPLALVLGAQGHRCQRLRLAAREDGRTMRARQFGDFAGEFADLVESAAVGPSFLVEYRLPEQRFLQAVEKLAGLGGLVIVVALLFDSLFLQGVDPGLTVEFAGLACIERFGQPLAPLV